MCRSTQLLKMVVILWVATGIMPYVKADRSSLQKAQRLFLALRPYILDIDIDAISVGEQVVPANQLVGTKNLCERLASIVARGDTITFLCLAFPFKSSNQTDLVAGDVPDMAEFHSLSYLQTMLLRLKAVYPNIKMTIMTDGLLFNDFFQISHAQVVAYEEQLKKLSQTFPDIQIVTLIDALQEKGMLLAALKDQVTQGVREKPIPKAQLSLLKRRICHEINHKNHAFFQLSRKHQKVYLDQTARALIQRDKRLKTFVQQYQTKNTIRLSIHYQPDISQKIGIRLARNYTIFPWNGVLVKTPKGQLKIVPKNRADLAHNTLCTQVSQPTSLNAARWR